MVVPTSIGNADEIQTFISDTNKAISKHAQEVKSATDEHTKLIAKIRELEIVVPGLSGHITDLTVDVKKEVDQFCRAFIKILGAGK